MTHFLPCFSSTGVVRAEVAVFLALALTRPERCFLFLVFMSEVTVLRPEVILPPLLSSDASLVSMGDEGENGLLFKKTLASLYDNPRNPSDNLAFYQRGNFTLKTQNQFKILNYPWLTLFWLFKHRNFMIFSMKKMI